MALAQKATERSPLNEDAVVIVPFFNEEGVLGAVLDDVRGHFSRVIAIDDGSTDGSVLTALRTGVVLVRHPFNMGQGAALQTGMERALLYADVEYFLTFDSDGQHRVSDALEMLECARRSEVDVVLGSRFLEARSNVPPLKRVLLRLVAWFTSLTTGITLSDAHNGLRVFNRGFASQLHLREAGMAHASEIISVISSGGFRYREWPVEVVYTDYSRGKGQRLINGVNIVFDIVFDTFRRK